MKILDWLMQLAKRDLVKGKKKAPPVAVQNSTGITVTEPQALAISTIWACLFLLSETIGGLPLQVYKNTKNGKEENRDNWVYALFKSPNADMTEIDFISYITCGLAFRGNAYIRISRLNNEIVAATPLDPGLCDVELEGRRKYYTYKNPLTGVVEKYDEDEIIHIPGFGYNGIKGMSLFDYAKQSLGISISGERAAGKAYSQALTLQGSLSTEQKLDDNQREKYRKSIDGLRKKGDPIFLLDQGLKFQPFTISPAELQMIENRKFNVEEICRWFGVPPALVGHTEKSTSWGSGMEQQDLSFLKYRLASYLTRVQQRFNKYLLPYEMRKDYFCEFNINALLKTDSQSRGEFYSKALAGWMTQNEIRAKENLPPDPNGDKLLIPVNMTTIDKLEKTATSQTTDLNIDANEFAELEVNPYTSLNGAQVTALMDLVRNVAFEQLPRDAAIGIIEVAFNMTAEQAERALGSVGNGFTPKPEGEK